MPTVGQTKTYTANPVGGSGTLEYKWNITPNTGFMYTPSGILGTYQASNNIVVTWNTANLYSMSVDVREVSSGCIKSSSLSVGVSNNVQCILPPTFVYWGAHENNTPAQLGLLSTGNGYNIDGIHGVAGDSLTTYVNSGAVLTVVGSAGITIDSFNENNFSFTGSSLGTHSITATLTCPDGSNVTFTQPIVIVLPTSTNDNVFVLNKCIGGFDNVLIGANSNLVNGDVIVASDGQCSTITGTAFSATETKTIINVYSNCNDCQVCTYVKVHNGSSQTRQIDGYGKCGQAGQPFGTVINLAPGDDVYICMSRYSITFQQSTIAVNGFQNIFSSSSSNDNEYFPAAGGVTASYVSGC